MATIAVAVSGLASCIDALHPAADAIVSAFSPYGVNFAFQAGLPPFAQDPEITGQWHDLVVNLIQSSRSKNPIGPAHLVATFQPPDHDPTINGMLMDQMRGVAAVFLGASIYQPQTAQQRPDLVAQVCVHELGHMLDLTHTDGVNGPGIQYANAMNQATERGHQLPQIAWSSAESDAQSRGEPTVVPTNPTFVYPFNAQCRAYLRAAADNWQWWPYQTKFRGNFQDGVSDTSRALTLEVEPHRGSDRCQRDGVLFVALKIRNDSDQPVNLPLHIGFEDGSLRLAIYDPSGDVRIYQPGKHRCSDARRLLLPRGEIVVPVSAASTAALPLFAESGRHRCEFSLVDLIQPTAVLLGRSSIEIDVFDSEDGRNAARALLQASVRKTPRVQIVAATHDDPAISSLESRTLLAKAKSLRDPRKRTERLRLLLGDSQPLAVRHSAALALALDRIRKNFPWQEVADELRVPFDGPDHTELFDSIRRSGEGWIGLKARAPQDAR